MVNRSRMLKILEIFRIYFIVLVSAVGVLGVGSPAHGLTIDDMTRLDGYGKSPLRGLGLVVGLDGTGDSPNGPMLRQLAKFLENNGSPIPDLQELSNVKNIALVTVMCEIPEEGALRGDTFDASVELMFDASSLEGGRLYITPMMGPLPGQGVWAMAQGRISIEGDHKTAGRVRLGAQMIFDHSPQVLSKGGTLRLNIKPQYAGWATAELLANTINQDRKGFFETSADVARALDAKSVLVQVPGPDLASPGNFIGGILTITLDPSLLVLPAKVIVNGREGTIVVSGNVEISLAVISHENLVVTTVTPSVPPTLENPNVSAGSWQSIGTRGDARSLAKLDDLLQAMKRLDVPVKSQIGILKKLHLGGHLHAEFIEE